VVPTVSSIRQTMREGGKRRIECPPFRRFVLGSLAEGTQDDDAVPSFLTGQHGTVGDITKDPFAASTTR